MPVCWKLTSLKIRSASVREMRALYRAVVTGDVKLSTSTLLKSISDCAVFKVAAETVSRFFSIEAVALTCALT